MQAFSLLLEPLTKLKTIQLNLSRCIHLTWTGLLTWLSSRTVAWRVYLEVAGSSTLRFAGLSCSQNEFSQFAEFGAWIKAGTALAFRGKMNIS